LVIRIYCKNKKNDNKNTSHPDMDCCGHLRS
jgi:hypothetical protein